MFVYRIGHHTNNWAEKNQGNPNPWTDNSTLLLRFDIPMHDQSQKKRFWGELARTGATGSSHTVYSLDQHHYFLVRKGKWYPE
jgi:hypothetical protein